MKHVSKKLCSILLCTVLLSGGILTDASFVYGGNAYPSKEMTAQANPSGRQGRAATGSDADSNADSDTGGIGHDADDETATPSVAAAPRLLSLSRVLLEDTFENGDNWKVSNAAVIKFTDGKATVKGGGPNNCMSSMSKINAVNFLIEAELTLNAGNTNSNTKIGFKSAEGFNADRLQLRFDYPHNKVYLERNGGKVYKTGAISGMSIGNTYQIQIQVQDDEIHVQMDGAELLSAKDDEIAAMGKGYFIIAGQFPKQDFSIDNLMITTDDAPLGEEYSITLKTATDGEEDAAGMVLGGTLTADKTTGYAGDVITLTTRAKHGYVFDKFTSFSQDGSSTDGLMPIVNGKFELNEKFGDVTVVAHFKTRTPGKNELLYDDFGTSLNADGQYQTIGDLGKAVITDEELVLDASSGAANYLLADQQIFGALKTEDGYRISVDARKANAASGTIQLTFRGDDEDISNRYALVINTQGVAMFRRFRDGKNDELAKCEFQFTEQMAHITVEVKDGCAVFLADGVEKMRYEDTDEGWSQMQPLAGLYNMTANAPVIYDNLLVERIPQRKRIEVSVFYQGEQDTGFKTGTAMAESPYSSEGEEVVLIAMPKTGYRLKEYVLENLTGVTLENGRFTMPSTAPRTVKIQAVFEDDTLRAPQTFYIDSAAGDDSADGTSKERAFKTVTKLASCPAFVPGDQILLKRGSVFEGQTLSFKGMGREGEPITISAYGEGELPRLAGGGLVENVVSLYNQEYIEIKNLEITNTASGFEDSFELNKSNNKSKALRAINVSIRDFGIAGGIHITDCYIHDINGNISLKWNGGIFFDVQAKIQDGELSGVLSKYDDVLISGCTFERVDRSGIKLVSSSWCNQWEANSPGVPVNWYPSTNVVVRDNYMEKIGGDGITVRDTDGALVEHNLVRDCRYQNTAYNVGIWPFEAANTVIQYNEAYDTRGVQDGQGLDCDHASSNTVMQYNYSHNNEGGFMLIMGGYPHTGATVRYNISQNDRDKAFEFAQGCPKGTMIYNNTIYSDTTIPKGIFYLSNTGAGLGVNDVFAYNNLFCYPAGQVLIGTSGDTAKMQDALKLYNNGYAGGMEPPADDVQAVSLAGSGMADPGKAPDTNATRVPYTGHSGKLDGYRLAAQSPFIDAGVTMDDAVVYFGGGTPYDGRALSPRELFDLAKSGKSIDHIVGENLPEIDGVQYNLDFMGNSLLHGDKPDIGAVEYGSTPPAGNPQPEQRPENDHDEPEVWTTKQVSSVPETPGSWVKTETGWNFSRPDGTRYKEEWIYVNGEWYWIGIEGNMEEGWNLIRDKWYYLAPGQGKMMTGWVQDGTIWYYLGSDGSMMTDTQTPDGYYVDSQGRCIR